MTTHAIDLQKHRKISFVQPVSLELIEDETAWLSYCLHAGYPHVNLQGELRRWCLTHLLINVPITEIELTARDDVMHNMRLYRATWREHAILKTPSWPCSCDGCWACVGNVPGCTCDVDWDAVAELRNDNPL